MSRHHMALVIDEHGTAVGIVTLEDLLEQIIGSVDDEFDERNPDFLPQCDGSHQVKADMSIRRFEELLDLPISTTPGAETLNGYIAHTLGRVPVAGDRLEYAPGVVLVVRSVELGRAAVLGLTREEGSAESTGAGASAGSSLEPPNQPH